MSYLSGIGRNRLRHLWKSCVCSGGAGGSACRARLRAVISQLLRGRFRRAARVIPVFHGGEEEKAC